MKWKGKLIGLLIGLLTRRPPLMLLGLLLGHLYDIGLFSGRPASPGDAATPGASKDPDPDSDADADADPYATLGIHPASSNEAVEQAYRRRMSEYHPDRLASAAPEIRELAGQRTREINGAYEKVKRLRGMQ